RRHPFGGVRALSLSPCHLRSARESQPQGHPRSLAARSRDPCAACDSHCLLRRLSVARPGRDGNVGQKPCRELSVGPGNGSRIADDTRIPMIDSTVLSVVLPELILAVGAIALLMVGVFMSNGEAAGRIVAWLAIGVLIAAGVSVFEQSGSSTVFN